MINQQLTDFIKQQLQLGSTKEKITSDLLANGWIQQDIEEGLKAASIIPTPTPVSFNKSNLSTSNTKSSSGRNVFLVLLIFLLLAGGASAYYFRSNLINLPIIKSLFANKSTTTVSSLNNNVQAVTQTQQPINASGVSNATNMGYEVTDPYNNLEQCNSLTGGQLDLCYIEVLTTTKNDSVCEKFTTQNDKNSCYAISAVVNGDRSLCSKAGNMLGTCNFLALVEIPNTNPKNCNGIDVQATNQCIASADALQKVMPLVQARTNQGGSPDLNLTMTPNIPIDGDNIVITAQVSNLVTGEKVTNINFMVAGGNTSVVSNPPYKATFKIAESAKGQQIYPVELLTNTGIYVIKNIVFNL